MTNNTDGRPEVVISAALLPSIPRMLNTKLIRESGNEKLTAGPSVLGARVPVFAAEAESKKVPIGVKREAWRRSDCCREKE